MEIEILFENEDLLVINKPAGVAVHPDGKSEKATVTDWILRQYPQIKGVGEPASYEGKEIDRPGIVHRLDEDTSGALIIAKTQEAFLYLKEQFAQRNVQKEYHAFVWGHFKEGEGVINEPIGRSGSDFRRKLAGRGARGELRDAETKWKVAYQFSDEKGERFSFMHLFPKTGRTHQLRVHLQYIQRPIVCDELYAPSRPQVLGFRRLALHAYKIRFFLPLGGEIEAIAPYPADFKSAIAQYGKS